MVAVYEYGEKIYLDQSLTSASNVQLATAANGVDTEVQIDADNDGAFETVVTLTGGVSGQLVVTSLDGYSNNVIRIVQPGVINPTTGDDFLIGTSGNDTIDALAGNDEILGLEGDDALIGGEGDDRIEGGIGADTIDGGVGNDTVYGGEGVDTITDTGGSNTIYGGADGDSITVSDSNGPIYGEAGADTITVTNFGGDIYGGSEADVISGSWNYGSAYGGAGDDSITLTGSQWNNVSIYGEGGSDNITLSGSYSFANILDWEGDNTIDISGYTSLYAQIYGGFGSYISTGDGVDTITGSDQNDQIYSGSGADAIDGGGGADTLYGGLGADALTGGAGGDSYRGSAADLNGDVVAVYEYGEKIYLDQSLTSASNVQLATAANGVDTEVQIDADNDGAFETVVTLTGGVSGQLVVTSLDGYSNNLIRIVEPSGGGGAPTEVLLDNSTIDESSSAGTVIGALSASDPDAGDTHTFTLLDNGGGAFEIVNGNELVVADGANLDFETQASYQISVRAMDSTGLSRDELLTISVNDLNEAPDSLTLTGGSVAESASEGQVVGALSATDPDAGDSLIYSLVDDAGGLFALVGNEIQLAPGATLDYETAASHDIAVDVTDSGGFTRSEVFTIAVTPVDEAPDSLAIAGAEVEENAAAGTLVSLLEATDPEGGPLTYALVDDAGGRFVIGGADLNEIHVADGANLDFETETSHSVTVEVTDSTGLSRTETVTIDVLNVEEAPTDILLTGGEVGEDATEGAVVATLDAIDPDGPSDITFALDDPSGLFEIVGNEIRVASGAAFDYESQNAYSVTVEAIDASGLSVAQSFTLNVLNANEAPTDITVTGGSVLENSAEGAVVASLAAIDPDAGDTFAFEMNDPSGLFEIVGNEIRVASGAEIDYETQTEYTVSLTVTDADGASFTKDVTISVENVAPVIIGDNAANTLNGTSEEDQIFGRGGADTLSGFEGDDQLFGESGNDRLIGGLGADALTGGIGNDVYVLTGDDVSQDTIVESAGQGTDTVEVDQNYTLGLDLENLVLTGTDDLQGFGNDANNNLTGNSGDNLLDGGVGADIMAGGLGDDAYYIDNTGDRANEVANAGTDEIRTTLNSLNISLTGMGNVENLTFIGTGDFAGTGNGLANVLTGGDGNDTLNGGGGVDVMVGGLGDDTYIVAQAGDQAIEQPSEGVDTVQSSVSFTLGAEVENLILTGGSAISGTGNDLDNALTGNSGGNTLDGGLGADTMIGGAGNDIYIVDDVGDTLTEAASAGTDTVRTTLAQFSFDSSPYANFENLTFTGAGGFIGTGNALANTLTGGGGADQLSGLGGNDTLVGNGGADILDGGLGNDTMRGGLDDDTYYVDSTSDSVSESLNQGSDTVVASVTRTSSLFANVENLILVGAVNGTGNGLDNVITGSDQDNTISAGGGADRVIGGGGADTLTGGSGNDHFVFQAGFGNDIVTDFDSNPAGGQDLLDISAFGITAADFASRISLTDLGSDILVTIDGNASQTITLTNAQLTSNITAQDFILAPS